MTAPAHYSTAYDAFDPDENYSGEFFPGERIGPPRAATGGRGKLRLGIVALVILGGGWMLFDDQATWLKTLPDSIAAVFAYMHHGEPMSPAGPSASAEPMATPAATVASPSPPLPLVSRLIAEMPAAAAEPVAPSAVQTGPAVENSGEQTVQPLPPPSTVHADAYQKRAIAVGLHPDLSHVLLERLSATDYRNAGIAIQTALTKIADTDVFVWPRQPKSRLALFEVRFVTGATQCRRYVVTVSKDGWSTTALPMEKCGVRAPVRSAAEAMAE